MATSVVYTQTFAAYKMKHKRLINELISEEKELTQVV